VADKLAADKVTADEMTADKVAADKACEVAADNVQMWRQWRRQEAHGSKTDTDTGKKHVFKGRRRQETLFKYRRRQEIHDLNTGAGKKHMVQRQAQEKRARTRPTPPRPRPPRLDMAVMVATS